MLHLRCLAALSAAAVCGALLLLSIVSAEGGVPLPAEAGSEWEIIAGYNTGTHSEADGDDRHAIDIVRIDAATGGSAALAPVSGVISYAGSDCLAITDGAEMEHLLCHIQPAAGLRRGLRVDVGERIGTVSQDGYGGNGGLAHIHYAVHRSRGGGYLGASIPFVGNYAIEQVELHDGSDFNMHLGTRFTSTNSADWKASEEVVDDSADSGAEDRSDAADTSDAAKSGGSAVDENEQPAESTNTGAMRYERTVVSGGWQAFAIERETTLGELWARRRGTLASLFFWDRGEQRWQRYQPGIPRGTEARNTKLLVGDAVLGDVKRTVAWLPRITQADSPPTLKLEAGWNLVSWHGPETPVAEALGGLDSLVSAFRWDNVQQRYFRWSPNGPDLINSLAAIPPGSTLWLQLEQPEIWPQQP